MTLVAALTNSFTSILIADSRLTSLDRDIAGHQNHFDLCQKTISLGDEAIVAFAGDLDTASKVVNGITEKYEKEGVSWLKSELERLDLLELLEVKPSAPAAEFLVTFIDREHMVMPGVPGAVVVKFGTNLPLRRSYMGFSMIGSGAAFQTQIADDPGLIKLLTFGGSSNEPVNVAHRAMFFAEVLAVTAAQSNRDDIGGLFQIHLVFPDGLYALPYKRWIDLGGGMGTDVIMDIDSNRQWVQVHEPTGLRIPLELPYMAPDEEVPIVFDMEEYLDISSPGVVPASRPQPLYQILGTDVQILRM